MADDKTLAQQYHETVEKLVAGGMKNADAIRHVAEQFGKNENAVRGGIHQYRQKLNGGGSATTTRTRRKTASVDDHLAAARQSIEEALALVDREVEQAKAALDAAQAHYDEVTASVKDRKAEIEKKLKALS